MRGRPGLDPAALGAESDPAVLLVVASLERWLAGAENTASITPASGRRGLPPQA